MRGLRWLWFVSAVAAAALVSVAGAQNAASHVAPGGDGAGPRSQQYREVQNRLATGWNTWDVHSVATQVLLPEGLAIHVGMKHNSSLNGDAFLGDALIGSFGPDAPVVTPGPHAWDGSYSQADFEWKGHKWRVESAHDGDDLVMLIAPLKKIDMFSPTLVLSVNFLWSRRGTVERKEDHFLAHADQRDIQVYWAFEPKWTHSEGRDSEESKFTAAHLKCSRRRPRIAGKGGCAGTPECRGDPRRDGFLTVDALLPRRIGAGHLRMGSALRIGATKSPFDAGIVTGNVA